MVRNARRGNSPDGLVPSELFECLGANPKVRYPRGRVNNAALRHAPYRIDSASTSDERVDCLPGPTFEWVRHDDAYDPAARSLRPPPAAQSRLPPPLCACCAYRWLFGGWAWASSRSRCCSCSDVVRGPAGKGFVRSQGAADCRAIGAASACNEPRPGRFTNLLPVRQIQLGQFTERRQAGAPCAQRVAKMLADHKQDLDKTAREVAKSIKVDASGQQQEWISQILPLTITWPSADEAVAIINAVAQELVDEAANSEQVENRKRYEIVNQNYTDSQKAESRCAPNLHSYLNEIAGYATDEEQQLRDEIRLLQQQISQEDVAIMKGRQGLEYEGLMNKKEKASPLIVTDQLINDCTFAKTPKFVDSSTNRGAKENTWRS